MSRYALFKEEGPERKIIWKDVFQQVGWIDDIGRHLVYEEFQELLVIIADKKESATILVQPAGLEASDLRISQGRKEKN
uniref:PH domain-containing protein n=1 Tax=Loa loa TaxID=7209 RepID=A0A1I7VA56_LOALO